MRVEVIVPYYEGGCPHRARALNYIRGLWQWPVTVAPGNSPWSKGQAVMPAVASSTADILIVADADVACDAVEDAVRAVHTRRAAWAIPHRILYRLSETGTAAVIAGQPWQDHTPDERPYPGIQGGGIVVARRDTLLHVPLDPRFVGWGQEDDSWAIALEAVCGPAWRGDAPLIHLWHPPQPRWTRRRGSRESWQLRGRYFNARRDPAAMTALLEEARAALNLAEPAGHAPAA